MSRSRSFLAGCVVLSLVLVAAVWTLVVQFGEHRPQATAGQAIETHDPIPVTRHFTMTDLDARIDIGAVVGTRFGDDLSVRKVDPPDGGRFVGLTVAVDPGVAAPDLPVYKTSTAGIGAATIYLLAGRHRYRLHTDDPISSGNLPLSLYVPVDGNPSLVLELLQAGRSQTVDLRTGRHDLGAFAGLAAATPYPKVTGCGSARTSPVVTYQDAGPACEFSAHRVGYAYGGGWAPAGHEWLDVQVTTSDPLTVLKSVGGRSAPYRPEFEPAVSTADRLDGAKPARTNRLPTPRSLQHGDELLFLVAAGSRHTLTLHRDVELLPRDDEDSDAPLSHLALTWTVRV